MGDWTARSKKGLHRCKPLIFGGGTRIRTLDLLIKSQLLYQLSYTPEVIGDLSDRGSRCTAMRPYSFDRVRAVADPQVPSKKNGLESSKPLFWFGW